MRKGREDVEAGRRNFAARNVGGVGVIAILLRKTLGLVRRRSRFRCAKRWGCRGNRDFAAQNAGVSAEMIAISLRETLG